MEERGISEVQLKQITFFKTRKNQHIEIEKNDQEKQQDKNR